MGPWWKYRFFRQKSVLAHNSIWTNFRGHINFKQATGVEFFGAGRY